MSTFAGAHSLEGRRSRLRLETVCCWMENGQTYPVHLHRTHDGVAFNAIPRNKDRLFEQQDPHHLSSLYLSVLYLIVD